MDAQRDLGEPRGGTGPYLDLTEAIRLGEPDLITVALRRLSEAPAAEWAAELNQAWDQGRADIALGAITEERLIDAIAARDLRLTDRWLEWLIHRGEIERITGFARLLQERAREIDEVAAGHLFVPVAHAIAFAHPGTARMLMNHRLPSIQEHWMHGHAESRALAGEVLHRLPPDLREEWARHLDDDDASSTLLPQEAAELVQLTRKSLGAQSRAFAKLGKFGPTSLREACAEAHRTRASAEGPYGAAKRRAPAQGDNSETGLSTGAIWLCLLAGGVLLVGFFSGGLTLPSDSTATYQTGEGTRITIGDPVARLPENLKPVYDQLRKKGCDALGPLVANLPPQEHHVARRRLLLAYSQDSGLSSEEKSKILATARQLLEPVDQNSIQWYLMEPGR